MESRAPEAEEYLWLDPKATRSKSPSRQKTPQLFNEAIVFVVGGGNYLEYQNLCEYSKVPCVTHLVF